jgi:glycosyltransferase involved in cell wall biosynthesis
LGNDYELVILGDGPIKNANIGFANHNNSGVKVNFVPFQMNPFPIISTGDYYLITSEFEGLPNSALEALGLGLPVFGFNSSGGLPEYINKDNGCLVEFGDVNGLAQVIKESKLRKGKSISKTVKEQLSLELICQQYLDTFLSLEKPEGDCN